MRFLTALLLLLLLAAPPARAGETEWTSYKNADYGFSLSYPARWHVFTQVHGRYMDKGLPAVFTLCLTPGPVKTLSCAIELYVIPAAKFAPPAQGAFLSLPATPLPADPAAGVFQGGAFRGADDTVNRTAAHNGFVYLWTQEKGARPPEDPQTGALEKMLASFRFTALRAPPACAANADCAAYCTGAGQGMECMPDGIPLCSAQACHCALTCR